MEGNGGGGGGSAAPPPWDLGMHWAAAGSAYPPSLTPRLGGPSQQQQQQQEPTWLKLGKRPYCWPGGGDGPVSHAGAGQVHGNGGGGGGSGCGGGGSPVDGRRKEKAAAVALTAVARCQVEGCHVALAGAKDYHRRHKVCVAHSKAPRVVVHGAEQRFCQQCSRFHAISEFDDAKRSCRRRLAGHNERRRRSNAASEAMAMARGAAHPHGFTSFGGHGGFLPCGLPATSQAGALSLLSSARGGSPWLIPAPDISTRSSAALDELIAENRAALLAWPFFADRAAASVATNAHLQAAHPAGGGGGAVVGGRYHEAPAPGHVTLDLMQATAVPGGAPFRPVPGRAATAPNKVDGGDAGCSSGSDAWAPVEEGQARVV
ncbi:hypothetical protein ACP4OV_004626 [Aristida adscensionis]